MTQEETTQTETAKQLHPEFETSKTLLSAIFDTIFSSSIGGNIDADSAKFSRNSVTFRTWEHDKEFTLSLTKNSVPMARQKVRKSKLEEEKRIKEEVLRQITETK